VTVSKAADTNYLIANSVDTTVTFSAAHVTVTATVTTTTIAPPPTDVPTSDLGTPVTGVAQSTVTTTVSLNLTTSPDTGTGTSSATSSIVIPPGALPAGTAISAYPITDTAPLAAEVPDGQAYVVSMSVTWQAPDGTSPNATKPITLTISDTFIVAGDVIYEVTPTGLVNVGTSSANGVVSITFTSDPTFIVAAPLVPQSALTLTSLKGTAKTPLTLVTSGGSGTGAISFTAVNGTARGCAVTEDSLTATSAGTCVVTATKAADLTYLSVSSTASVTFKAPRSARVTPVSVTFTYGSNALSGAMKAMLITLSRKLTNGSRVTLIGFALKDSPLAISRVRAVKYYLWRFKSVAVNFRIVTNVSARSVKIVTTKV
jgi:hypothetical protein